MAAADLARQSDVAGALQLIDLWLREQIEAGAAPGLVVFELGADGKVERLRWRFEYLTPVKSK